MVRRSIIRAAPLIHDACASRSELMLGKEAVVALSVAASDRKLNPY